MNGVKPKMENSKRKGIFYRVAGLITKQHIIIPLIFVFSFILFLLNNTHEQLWYDEAITMYFSDLAFDNMLNEIGFNGTESNPPLYHLVIKALRIIFGDNLFILRGFSALCTSLMLVIIYWFVRKKLCNEIALIATLTLLANPVIISFAQELRMYALVSLVVFLSIIFFYLWLDKNQKRFFFLYILFVIIGIYTHYYALFIIFISSAYFIKQISKKHTSHSRIMLIGFYVTGLAIILVAFLPWLLAFMQQINAISDNNWTETPDNLLFFKAISYFVTTKFARDVNIIPHFIISSFILIVGAYGVYYSFRTKKYLNLIFLFLAGFITPLLLSFIYSSLFHSIINFRYFILFFPCYMILFAFGIYMIPYKKCSIILLIIYLLFISPSIFTVYTERFNGSAEDVAKYLQSTKSESGLITFEASSYLTLYYYLERSDNLYYYSEQQLSVSHGININSNNYYVGAAIEKIFHLHDSIYLIPTPWTMKQAEDLIDEFDDFIIDNHQPPVEFIEKNSWFRNKVIHLVKNMMSDN
ncbi:MAG: glycosyltransferase family 39 protein [Spirochaetales bacterium]|nr:glycosyltransferase family 39 protein [Spirochaetales bacterium]